MPSASGIWKERLSCGSDHIQTTGSQVVPPRADTLRPETQEEGLYGQRLHPGSLLQPSISDCKLSLNFSIIKNKIPLDDVISWTR